MNAGSEQLTGLRDVRKPCHFWVDNEVADCYQPIVGADAIWVYCRIARNAHGAWIVSPKVRGTDTRVSLREMAEWCGKSVDTVWRCLQVLEHVGLLKAVHGAKAKGRYALADVKDLVTSQGGIYDRELGSFQLPAARVAELMQQIRELRLKLARKKAGVVSVAQSDSLGEVESSAPETKCDRSVAQSDKTVAPSATDNFLLEESKTAKQNTPPIAPRGACGRKGNDFASETKDSAASVAGDVVSGNEDRQLESGDDGGCGADAGVAGGDEREPRAEDARPGERDDCRDNDFPLTAEQLADLERYKGNRDLYEYFEQRFREENRAAVLAAEAARVEAVRIERMKAMLKTTVDARAWVMRQCNLVDDGRKRGIGTVIDAVLEQQLELGNPLWETAPKMAAARNKFAANGELITTHWGPVKFFKLGIWADERGWGWNEAKLERMRGASVGSAR